MTAFIDASDATRVAAEITGKSIRLQIGLARQTAVFGSMLLNEIMRNVSTGSHPPGAPHIAGTGPGPNVATGDYRRSWNMRLVNTPTEHVAEVGTNAPQGPRLEYGFVGADSLGRVYDQPPYPHATPAKEKIEPLYVAALTKMLQELDG